MRQFLKLCTLNFLLTLVVCSGVIAEAGKAEGKEKDKKSPATEAAPSEAAPPATNFTCEANVYYSWKRLPPKEQNASGKEEKGQKSSKVEIIQPDEAFFTKLSHTAPTQATAEASVRERLASAQGDARRECERLHQNLSGCMANNMRSVKAEYNTYDFELRRKYAEAVQEDCQLDTGLCVSTRAGDIACFESAAPTVVSTGAAQAEDGKAAGKSAEKTEKDGEKGKAPTKK